jgi:hypothetical protein
MNNTSVKVIAHIVANHSLCEYAKLAAVATFRQITDSVNLCEGFISKLYKVELSRGGVAVIESLISKVDGGHF